MRVTSGANKQPPCDSNLCGPVPNHKLREEVVRGGGGGSGGGFIGLISFAAYSWNTILRPVPRKMIKFKINFDTVELQKTYGKIKVFEKLITDFFALQI